METCERITVDRLKCLIEPARKRSNRHYVTVTVEDVIVAIGEIEEGAWTTRDVAAALGVKEQAVRATIHQLKIRRLIREAGRVVRRTSGTAKEYYPMSYEIVLAWGPADFEALNRTFVCRG